MKKSSINISILAIILFSIMTNTDCMAQNLEEMLKLIRSEQIQSIQDMNTNGNDIDSIKTKIRKLNERITAQEKITKSKHDKGLLAMNDKKNTTNTDGDLDHNINTIEKDLYDFGFNYSDNKFFGFNFGVGYKYINGIGTPSIPPVSLSGLFNVIDNLKVGPALSFYSEKYGMNNLSYFHLGGKASYEFFKKDRFTFSGNGIMNLKLRTDSNNLNLEDAKSDLFFGLTVDAKYWLTHNFAMMIEAGYGFSMLNIGLNYSY